MRCPQSPSKLIKTTSERHTSGIAEQEFFAMDEKLESTNTTWTVWRMDETGNRFVVRDRLPLEAAERMVEEFAARGHKQTYWSEQQE
jgi:UDP-N-acetyl-2-amino-2-deoxyglucuronate dehydrogenase